MEKNSHDLHLIESVESLQNSEGMVSDSNFFSTSEDKFSKGEVIKFFSQSRYGFIKNRWDKDVYFNLDEVRFVGSKGEADLREGLMVGFDVGWTSHGIHVSKIKIY